MGGGKMENLSQTFDGYYDAKRAKLIKLEREKEKRDKEKKKEDDD